MSKKFYISLAIGLGGALYLLGVLYLLGGDRPASQSQTQEQLSVQAQPHPDVTDKELRQGKFARATHTYVACVTLQSLMSALERSGDAGEGGAIAYYTKYHSPCIVMPAGSKFFIAHVSVGKNAVCASNQISNGYCLWFPADYIQVNTEKNPLVPGATGQWPVGQMYNFSLDHNAY